MLADFFQSDPTQGGNGNGTAVNASAMDRRSRSVRRSARDNGMRKPAAMDANIRTLNDKSFAQRWADAAKVNSGFGRY